MPSSRREKGAEPSPRSNTTAPLRVVLEVAIGKPLSDRGFHNEFGHGRMLDIDLCRRALVCGPDGEYVVSGQRAPDTLERELTHRLDCHSVLNSHQHAGTYEDLPWLRFIA